MGNGSGGGESEVSVFPLPCFRRREASARLGTADTHQHDPKHFTNGSRFSFFTFLLHNPLELFEYIYIFAIYMCYFYN